MVNSMLNKTQRAPDIYKQSHCVMEALMTKIETYCGCYLSYVENIEDYISSQNDKRKSNLFQWFLNILACDFEQHGVCVGYILGRFKWKRQKQCLPACHSFDFTIDNIQVTFNIFQSPHD